MRAVVLAPTSEELAELKRPKRENAELRRANDIPKAAASFFGAGSTASRRGDRVHRRAQGPAHRHAPVGIEPIAEVLGVAPFAYHASKSRPASVRAVRDAELLRPLILQMWEEKLSVYGADKIWTQLNDDGVRVARCIVERSRP